MEEIWHDGTRNVYSDLTPADLASKLHAAAENAEKIAVLRVWSEDFFADSKTSSGPYPDNRQGRRRWQRELRKKIKA